MYIGKEMKPSPWGPSLQEKKTTGWHRLENLADFEAYLY
jgi:hypothetical protein